MDIEEVLLLWFTNFLIKIKQNLQLAEKLHKPIIRNLKKEQFLQDLNIIFGVLI